MTHLIENDTDKKIQDSIPFSASTCCLQPMAGMQMMALPSDLALTDGLGLQGPLCWLVVCL